MTKLTNAMGRWLLRQDGWHLALSLWYMLCPMLLALEAWAFFAGGGYRQHRVHIPALLCAVAIVLVVPPVIAVGLAGYLLKGWRQRGWPKSRNDEWCGRSRNDEH